MRRNDSTDIRKKKIEARISYENRKIDQWVKWSINMTGVVRFKDLMVIINKYKNN